MYRPITYGGQRMIIIEPFDLNSEYFYSSIFSKKEEEEEDKIRYFVKEKSDTNDSSSVRITKEKTNNLIKVFNLQTPTIHKKRGRKPKDGNENLKTDEKKLSRKYDMDDIMIKNQIAERHNHTFLFCKRNKLFR